MYSLQMMGSVMPTVSRWAVHRAIHLAPNSVSGSSRGMKFPAKTDLRPAVVVPTI